MYKLRTVDVWDTLLRRDCHPECVKLATAAHLLFGWPTLPKPAFRTHWALYRARVEAERELAEATRAAGHDDEYEITGVLRLWLESVAASPFDAELPAQLAEFELSVEIARSFRDPDIGEFLAPHGAERTLFLSDFYMDSGMLGRLLEAKGLGELVSDGISSCDTGFNKRSGRLFRHVHETHGVDPREHIHFGDNAWSDVESAAQSGVKAIHYLPEQAHAERCERERLFVSREVLFQHLRALAGEEADMRASVMEEHAGAAFRLGIEAAPLFIGFAVWIAEQAVVQRLDRLFFLTREGEFFRRVFAVLFPDGRFCGHPLPAHGDLEVSRLSTFAASLGDVSVEELARIWRLFRTQKVGGLFATLGLRAGDFAGLLAEIGLSPDLVVERPESNPALARLLQAPVFREAALNAVAAQRGRLLDYLGEHGFVAGKRLGVVDIGWRGTIQDNLAHVVPDAAVHGMYLGLRKPINPQPATVSKAAYAADERHDIDTDKLFEAFAALEMICSSPNGSVEGYVREGGRVKVCRNVSLEENTAYDGFARYFQDGVVLAAEVWRPFLERYVVTSADLHASARRVWEVLCEAPSPRLAQLFLETPQHDMFGFGEFYSRNQAPSIGTILSAPFRRKARREVLEFVRRVQWTSGVRHLQGVGPVHRQTLVALFTAANAAKRYRMKARRGR